MKSAIPAFTLALCLLLAVRIPARAVGAQRGEGFAPQLQYQ
jgi:hypothetical protein